MFASLKAADRCTMTFVQNAGRQSGGAFDDTSKFRVAGEMYTDSALPWARLGCELTRPGEPDDTFRKGLVATTRQ